MKRRVHSKRAVGPVIAAGISAFVLAQTAHAGNCNVDYSSIGQTIQGFGACTIGWQGGLSSTEMARGFGTAGGVGLTIARIEAPATTDSSQWAAEVGRGAQAKNLGAIVMATPWSPPASMKNNNNTVGGYLNSWMYDDYAIHLNNFVTYARNNGCSLHAISVQNEPDISVDYVSCDWTADQLKTFCKNEMWRFYSTKVIMPESFHFNKDYSNPTLYDSTAAANVDIIGGHIYGGGISYYNLAKSMGKEVWMTEHLLNDQSMSGIMSTAKSIHQCMADAQYNAYIYWYLKRVYGPLDENGNRSKRGCVMAQYARWVRPGYVRVSATSNPSSNVYVSAYKGSKGVIVAVNTGSSAVYQTFSMSGRSISNFNRYRTSSSENLATLSSFSPGSSFGVMLPAQSITTYVEQ